jgi:hypothetical protein
MRTIIACAREVLDAWSGKNECIAHSLVLGRAFRLNASLP